MLDAPNYLRQTQLIEFPGWDSWDSLDLLKTTDMSNRKMPYYDIDAHDARFPDEESCRDHLVKVRWDGRPKCQNPNCQNQHLNYYISSRKVWKCSKCKKQFSPTKGTIFENSNVPLKKWFKAIYYFTTSKRGISSCQLAKWCGTSQKTAWFMLHRIREALVEENSSTLEGIVEVDETGIGPDISEDTRLQRAKKKHDEEQERIHGMSKKKKRHKRGEPAKRGRKKGSTKEVLAQKKKEKEALGERTVYEQDYVVLGMAQRDGKIVLKCLGRSLKSKTKKKIYSHLKKHISSSSVIYTDQWNFYDDLPDHFQHHDSVNHSEDEWGRDEVYTNTIENVWKHFKKVQDGTYFHFGYSHFDSYLNEHAFRWNRLTELALKVIYDDFMSHIEGKRLKYHELITRVPDYEKLAA